LILGSFNLALISTALYVVIGLSTRFYAHAFTNRPIVVVPIMGMVLGNPALGLQLGAELELIFIGITTIGGSLPSDVFLAGTLVGALVIGTGITMEAGLVLAVAVGVVAAMFTLMNRIVVAGAFVPLFDKWAAEGNYKTYRMWSVVGQFVLEIIPAITVFFAIYLGADAVKSVMSAIPAQIQKGMSVAAGMMPAVGIALLASMLWSWKASIYFFFGFAVIMYLKINMTALIVIAAFITVLQVYMEMKIRDVAKASGSAGKGDDLFG
jgi:mannose/fructose/N-acetylgalactosamine-specific phosphotransferase system component IIC